MSNSPAQLHGLLVIDKPGIESFESATDQHDSASRVSAQDETNQAPLAATGNDAKTKHSTPRLPTSHDIVYRVRRWSGQKRIGHTGTLDPMASGVLVLTMGIATRLTEYYQGHDKRYEAEVTLGYATDTYDRTGKVTGEAAVPPLQRAEIEAALDRFRGTIEQIPPAYSALKQDGATAYDLARKGTPLTLQARQVTIYQLDLLDFKPPDRLVLAVHCSTGTYIRSLAYDLGQTLGTLGVLSGLRRSTVGPFSLSQAHSVAEVEALGRAGALAPLLLPTGFGLGMAQLRIEEDEVRRLGFGQQITAQSNQFTPSMASQQSPLPTAVVADEHFVKTDEAPQVHTIAQAIDRQNHTWGIVRCLATTPTGRSVWRAEKWFQE